MSEIAGRHGFSGQCEPQEGARGYHWKTFSLGIFQWLPKASGSGLKRSKVKVRVIGSSNRPELARAKAQEIASALDAGSYSGPKTVTVRAPEPS